MTEAVVYFIGSDDGPIKIGTTTGDVDARLRIRPRLILPEVNPMTATATPAQIEEAGAFLEKWQKEVFDPIWAKVASHAAIGGAVRTFINPSTGLPDIEAINAEDTWRVKPKPTSLLSD